jgi:Domain of unknown function (DUF1707)
MALIGDRDRERAAALLGRHFASGRLSLDELSARLETALTARRDGDLRGALADLPRARIALDGAWRAARRAAFVVALWTLWWAGTVILLIGFVASVVAQGLSLWVAAVFAGVWLVGTLGVRRATRR